MVWPSASAPIYAALCHQILSSFKVQPPAPPNPRTALQLRPCQRRADEVAGIAMDEFPLITDGSMLFQSRGMLGASTWENMLVADGGLAIPPAQDEHKNKGKDLLFCDLPEFGGFDFETDLSFDPMFEIGSNYFDDALWSSIYSPDAQLVPSSCFDSINVSTVRDENTIDSVSQSSVSVPDQINMTHPTNILQQQTTNDGMDHTPSSCEAHASYSSGEIVQFAQYIDAELFFFERPDAELFGPFNDDISSAKKIGGCEGLEAILCSNRDMRAPTSSVMRNDASVVPSSACSGPDLVAAHIPCSNKKLQDPLHGSPDMLLEGMSENPLEMYFPPLTTYEPLEMPMSNTSTQTYQSPEKFAGSGVPNSAGLQFCSKQMTSAYEQPHRSTIILEAVPVKDLGFQKLQKGMNQMDVATKGRIRDALYRMANSVEQRHYAASTSGVVRSSGSTRFRSGRWTETQTDHMDQSVAQLLLKKRPHRNSALPHRVT